MCHRTSACVCQRLSNQEAYTSNQWSSYTHIQIHISSIRYTIFMSTCLGAWCGYCAFFVWTRRQGDKETFTRSPLGMGGQTKKKTERKKGAQNFNLSFLSVPPPHTSVCIFASSLCLRLSYLRLGGIYCMNPPTSFSCWHKNIILHTHIFLGLCSIYHSSSAGAQASIPHISLSFHPSYKNEAQR